MDILEMMVSIWLFTAIVGILVIIFLGYRLRGRYAVMWVYIWGAVILCLVLGVLYVLFMGVFVVLFMNWLSG